MQCMKFCTKGMTSHVKLLMSSPTTRKAYCNSQIYKVYEPCHVKTNVLHMRTQDADQHRDNRKADKRLCFRYIDSTIPLLSKSKF